MSVKALFFFQIRTYRPFFFFFQAIVVDFLNLLGGGSERSFWSKEMPKLLQEKFGHIEMLDTDFGRADDLKSRFSVPLVQLLLAEAMGARWESYKSLLFPLEGLSVSDDLRHLTQVVYLAPVQKTDLSPMEPRVSTAPLANWFDGRAKLNQAYALMEDLNLWASLRVLESARISLTQHDPNVEVGSKWLFLVSLK